MQQIELSLDADQPKAMVSRLLVALGGRQDAIDAFLKRFDVLPELFRVDLKQLSTGGAIHLRAVFEPTDFLRELVTAVGAGDVDGLLIENRIHGGTYAS